MEESVKYANDFNCLLLPNLTEREMNIFMTILAKIKDGNRITTISVHNFKGYKESFSRTLEVVQSFSNKILNYQIQHIDKRKQEYTFVCFNKLELNFEEKVCEIVVQEEFYNFIMNYQAGFTNFKLSEFVKLSGKYTKTLYRFLQQFRNTGRVIVFKERWDDFCKLMHIPKTFDISKIDSQILNPAIKQLSLNKNPLDNIEPIFKNLKYKKIKDKRQRGQGGKVVGIEFYFTPDASFKFKTKQEDKFQARFLPVLFADVVEIIRLPLLILEIPRLIKWIAKSSVKIFKLLKKKKKIDLRAKALKSN